MALRRGLPDRVSRPRPPFGPEELELVPAYLAHRLITLEARERLLVELLLRRPVTWGRCTHFPGRGWACHRRLGGDWPVENWCANCLGWYALGLQAEMQRAGLPLSE